MPSAFVFDPNRCTGCQACELACSIENDLGTDRSWREVVTFNDAAVAGVSRFHLSLACNHCAEPACMYSCPALAYERDGSSGAILLDPNRCIGCRYCSWACPYGAPRFEEENGVMGKCTFCSHRLDQGLKPACATLCPTGALDFQDLPVSEMATAVPGFPQTDLGPSIRIEPVRRSLHLVPGITGSDGSHAVAPPPPPSPGSRSARSGRWPRSRFSSRCSSPLLRQQRKARSWLHPSSLPPPPRGRPGSACLTSAGPPGPGEPVSTSVDRGSAERWSDSGRSRWRARRCWRSGRRHSRLWRPGWWPSVY